MVSTMNWSDRYKLGIEEIDNQHLELINRINKLVIANDCDENSNSIIEILDFLKNYIIEHFAYEEKLQRKYDYPDYGQHRALHFNFVKSIGEYENQYKKLAESDSFKDSKKLLLKINGELIEWLSDHINDSDRMVANHILSKSKSVRRNK